MTIFVLLLGGLAAFGIVASIVAVSRDGYRRQPSRPLVRTHRDTLQAAGVPEPADVRPSDIAASQRLSDAASASQDRVPRHAAGAMVMRPR